MAERTTIVTDVATVAEEAYRRPSNLEDARRARQRARRVEALSLKLAGFSTAQIAERMGSSPIPFAS